MREDVLVLPDHETASRKAAGVFAETVRSAVDERGRCAVAVSGGTTPKRLFALLGSEYGGAVPWSSMHLFWADERCVPPEHAHSNYRLAAEILLPHIALPAENIHRIRGEADPAVEALRYELELRSFFPGRPPVFDLVLLGMGADGHTASLFPGTSAADEQERLVLPVRAGQGAEWRVTLTLPVLNSARTVVLLVTGKEKAAAVRAVLEDDAGRMQSPAGRVQPAGGRLLWLLDEGSASLLRDRRS